MNTRFDDAEVSAVYETAFGGRLFNTYTLDRQTELLFSYRLRVVRAMIRAMLDEEAAIIQEQAKGPTE